MNYRMFCHLSQKAISFIKISFLSKTTFIWFGFTFDLYLILKFIHFFVQITYFAQEFELNKSLSFIFNVTSKAKACNFVSEPGYYQTIHLEYFVLNLGFHSKVN